MSTPACGSRRLARTEAEGRPGWGSRRPAVIPDCKERIPLLLAGPLWLSPAGVERKKNIPPRYAVRLEDLRAWHVVFATCAACRKRSQIAVRLLQHGRPPCTRLLDLERKLRCSSCGNRQGNIFSVSIAPRS